MAKVGRPKKKYTPRQKLTKRLFSGKSQRKVSKRRQEGTRRLLGAMGIGGRESQAGPGRPRGTYKHGMPIHVYKKLMQERRMKQQVYQQQQLRALQQRGISPEQFQQLQIQRTIQQPQQFRQQVQQQAPVDDGGYRETPEQIRAQVNDELAFRRWSKDRTISPNTRQILTRLMRTQNKAKTDDIEMQRRIMERKMVSKAGSLLATPYIFNQHQLNLTGIPEDNILLAPNTFREDPEDFILKQKRPGILNTKETGNNLMF